MNMLGRMDAKSQCFNERNMRVMGSSSLVNLSKKSGAFSTSRNRVINEKLKLITMQRQLISNLELSLAKR